MTTLFYDFFVRNKSSNGTSKEEFIWKSLKDDENKNKEYSELYQKLKLGVKFKRDFNSQEKFIARLFELYTHKLLRSSGVTTTYEAKDNSEIDLIFNIQGQKFICELCCINPQDKQIHNTVAIQEGGWLCQSPPGDNDQAVNRIRSIIRKKAKQLLCSAKKADVKLVIFCDAPYTLSESIEKSIGLSMKLRRAIYGKNWSDSAGFHSQAENDLQLQNLTSQIDYIILCDYVPEQRVIPLSYTLFYPYDGYRIGRNELEYDKRICEIFNDKN